MKVCYTVLFIVLQLFDGPSNIYFRVQAMEKEYTISLRLHNHLCFRMANFNTTMVPFKPVHDAVFHV